MPLRKFFGFYFEMEIESLERKFKELLKENLPFVFFQHPNTSVVSLYHQATTKLHSKNQLDFDGFAFNSFNFNSQNIYIPKENHTLYRLNESRAPEVYNQKDLRTTTKEKVNFIELVKSAKDFIERNNTPKIVVSKCFTVPLRKSCWNIYSCIINLYPETFKYFWSHPKLGLWFGASPELFLEYYDGIYKTVALAGTQKWDPKKKLMWHKKEKEEQLLVQQQIIDDLTENLDVVSLLKNETMNQRAGNLVHLSTNFQFRADRNQADQICRELHPTSAVAGRPKKKVLEFISFHEKYNRSFYTGYYGPITHNTITLYVNLRCAQIIDNEVLIYVGAGITEKSDPEFEWLEILAKAQAILRVL